MENYLENEWSKRGSLILIGGAEDKTGNKTILKEIVTRINPKTIALIPSASAYPKEVYDNYNKAFKELGVEHIELFDIRNKEEADNDIYLTKITNADLVFLSGGDQVKLFEVLNGTKLLKLIRELFYKGAFSIAGTSAGSAIASNPMIYDGDYKGFIKGTVCSSEGFGLVDQIAVDTHFLNRERIPRLIQFMIAQKMPKGIGLDEDTSVFISPDLTLDVVGSGMVTLMATDKNTYNNFNDIQQGQAMSINNFKIGFLPPGASFDLKSWTHLKSHNENLDFTDHSIFPMGAFI